MNIETTTTPAELEQILNVATSAATALRRESRTTRARYLVAVADAIDNAVDQLVPIAQRETNLPEGRLRGEVQRTTFQLRLFSEVVAEGRYLDMRIDHADPDWPMGAPRPDLRRTHLPLGPVAVFAASNFPFAFSVAGGDTASALASGCPVVVKAHSAHLELSQATAQVITEALDQAGAPAGMFAIVYGTETGRTVVQDPRIKAVGFTGSIPGGRALFDLAQAREAPIPFYGELGSNNPVFVTEAADRERGGQIAEEFIASYTLGAGQFCTKPGTLILPPDSHVLQALKSSELPGGSTMLNTRIRDGYFDSVKDLQGAGAAVLLEGTKTFGEDPTPILHLVTAEEVLNNPTALLEECFGPSSLIVETQSTDQYVAIAEAFEGQLTASVQAEEHDELDELIDVLVTKAGRVLWNQWPTGVSVTYAQQHGGPYPASTASGTTSVGTAAITRFIRPIAYQGFPDHQLPPELRNKSSDPAPRMVNGK